MLWRQTTVHPRSVQARPSGRLMAWLMCCSAQIKADCHWFVREWGAVVLARRESLALHPPRGYDSPRPGNKPLKRTEMKAMAVAAMNNILRIFTPWSATTYPRDYHRDSRLQSPEVFIRRRFMTHRVAEKIQEITVFPMFSSDFKHQPSRAT
jgi:hypothetical protein